MKAPLVPGESLIRRCAISNYKQVTQLFDSFEGIDTVAGLRSYFALTHGNIKASGLRGTIRVVEVKEVTKVIEEKEVTEL